MRCRSCNNTETFKHKYTADVTETLDFCNENKLFPLASDTDIEPFLYEDLVEEVYWCVKCLSDDIDVEGYGE